MLACGKNSENVSIIEILKRIDSEWLDMGAGGLGQIYWIDSGFKCGQRWRWSVLHFSGANGNNEMDV